MVGGELPDHESVSMWLAYFGLGCLWLGGQIVWVAPLPRQLRRGEIPTAPAGSEAAFGLFWIDQYGWIGIVLCALGTGCFFAGLLMTFSLTGGQ